MAALGEFLTKRMRAQASCAVCEGFYTDPVQLRCGASFCRACVAGLTPPLCPEPDCGAEFDPARLAPSPSLARLVEIAKQLLEREASTGVGAAGGEEPPQRETVFCKQENVLICRSCFVPEDHPGHEVVPADKAAQQYKVHLQKCLVHLKREERDMLLNKTTLEVDCEYYYMRASVVWEKAKTEFLRIEDFLDRQKRWLLAQVTEVYKEMKMNKNEQLSALAEKQSFLQELICEMQRAIHMPGNERLENIGNILQKFEERETVEPRGSLSLDLQNKISGLIDYQMFITETMQHLRENVACRFNSYIGIPPPPSANRNEVDASEEPHQSAAQPSDPESSGMQSE